MNRNNKRCGRRLSERDKKLLSWIPVVKGDDPEVVLAREDLEFILQLIRDSGSKSRRLAYQVITAAAPQLAQRMRDPTFARMIDVIFNFVGGIETKDRNGSAPTKGAKLSGSQFRLHKAAILALVALVGANMRARHYKQAMGLSSWIEALTTISPDPRLQRFAQRQVDCAPDVRNALIRRTRETGIGTKFYR